MRRWVEDRKVALPSGHEKKSLEPMGMGMARPVVGDVF
jgi:hypothetical protein